MGTHIAIAIMSTIYCAVPLVALVVLVPKFAVVFRDYSTELPGATKFVLSLSRWASNQYGWVFMLPVIAAVVFLGIIIDQSSETGAGLKLYRRVVVRMLLPFLMLALTALIIFACYLPMISLVTTLAQ